jgi:hypothetical protein
MTLTIIIFLFIAIVASYVVFKMRQKGIYNAAAFEKININEIKKCDDNNKIINIEHNNWQYLILINKNGHNLLLDKYKKERPVNNFVDDTFVKSERY